MNRLQSFFILFFCCFLLSSSLYARPTTSDTPKISLIGNPLMCIPADTVFYDSFKVSDKDWQITDLVISKEGCLPTKKSLPSEIYKFRYKVSNPAGNVGYSAYRYYVIRAKGDHGKCVLTDSLKDTCMKLAPASAVEKQTLLVREIRIYPIPADQTVHIVAPDGLPSIFNVRVMDMSGRCMLRQECIRQNTGGAFTVNTSSLASGMYILELQTSEATVSKSLSIVR